MKSIIPPRRIAYSTEVLFHFVCGECKSWWSMSDDEGKRVREFTCPHCKFSAPVHLPEVMTEASGSKLNPEQPALMNNYPLPNTLKFKWLLIDTIAGPWFSLGFHIDFQRPYLDLHFIWWIITIGNYYNCEILEEYEA